MKTARNRFNSTREDSDPIVAPLFQKRQTKKITPTTSIKITKVLKNQLLNLHLKESSLLIKTAMHKKMRRWFSLVSNASSKRI